MSNKICPIHNMAKIAFGPVDWCSKCEDEQPSVEFTPTVAVEADYGFITRLSAIDISSGEFALEPSEPIWMKQPPQIHDAYIYRINLRGVRYCISGDGKIAYAEDVFMGVPIEAV